MSGNNNDDEHDEKTYFAGGEHRSRERVCICARAEWYPGAESGTRARRRAWRECGAGSVEESRRRARSAGASAARLGLFSGGGHTLGGERSASTYVPVARDMEDELAIRRLTFWRDGFTVEDEPLIRRVNADVLADIHAGHAPPSILNVRPEQRVDVQASRRTEDDYLEPRSRLRRKRSINPRFEVDTTQPTSIQACLADRTRLIARMNLAHTVGDLCGFIRSLYHRHYLPTRALDSAGDARTVKEAGLSGVVVVQSWV
ncbi:SEP-domain-containing protein [Mycena olivaceomarginata]|nr:SEP-domain-containing protein [Mycena olivaceomarginata]